MENIEAMLCAYIEGDLDQSGRAEIEKHLQANPQHRKLIEELIATRDMVRRLPRVSAPLDVGESLRGHVERSILLEDSTPTPGSRPMSIGRGRRLLAIAAVFLLVAGTGIVIVQRVLPGFKPPQSPTENMQARITPNVVPEERSVNAAHAPADAMLNDATRASRMNDALAATPPLNNPVIPVTFDLAAIQRRLESSGYAAAPGQADSISPVYLVIQSPNPSMTNEKIARFLNSNGITFSPIPERMLATNITTMPSLDDVGTRAMSVPAANNANNANNNVATPPASAANDNARYDNNANNNNANVPANAGAQATNAVPPEDQSNMVGAKRSADAPSNVPPALEQVTGTEQNQIAAAPASRPAAEIDKALAFSQAEGRQPDLYVARGMTHKQADELRDALASQQDAPVTLYDQLAISSNRGSQTPAPTTQPAQALVFTPKPTTDASVIGKDESKVDAAATQPSDTPLAAGDLIEVHLANVDLPPGDNALQTLTVAEDGTIGLPGIGPVRVAGSTLSQAQAAITKVYADAKLNVEPQPEVAVRRPQVAQQGGKPGEDALDVVIVIQNAPQPQPQAQPQTVITPQIQAAPTTQP